LLMRLGFVGMGIMGSPMAQNLKKAGPRYYSKLLVIMVTIGSELNTAILKWQSLPGLMYPQPNCLLKIMGMLILL